MRGIENMVRRSWGKLTACETRTRYNFPMASSRIIFMDPWEEFQPGQADAFLLCVWQVFLAHLWQLTLAHLWPFAEQA